MLEMGGGRGGRGTYSCFAFLIVAENVLLATRPSPAGRSIVPARGG